MLKVHPLVWLLLIGLALRACLALQGGQYSAGDEVRFSRSQALYRAVLVGDSTPMKAALSAPDHLGFTVTGALAIPVQHGVALLADRRTNWRERPGQMDNYIGVAALVIGLAGLVNSVLLYRLVLVAGGGRSEALWAAGIFIFANTSLYNSRHLLPYESALMFLLLAFNFMRGAQRAVGAFGSGVLLGAAYHVYNGYWYCVLLALFGFLIAELRGAKRVDRVFWCGVGAFLAVLVPYLLGVLFYGGIYWDQLRHFSGSVINGSYSEGWTLPWEYFYYAEAWYGAVVVTGIVAAMIVLRGRIPMRARVWLVLALGAYLTLGVASAELRCFVVYGRSLRPLVPFLCAAGAWAVIVLEERGLLRRWVFAAALALAFAWNYSQIIFLSFPLDLERAVIRSIGFPKRAYSLSGSIWVSYTVTAPEYALVNAWMFYPVRKEEKLPEGDYLLRTPHPLSYKPYQYESHDKRQRTLLRHVDIRMGLMRLAHPERVPDYPPIEQWLSTQDLPDGKN